MTSISSTSNSVSYTPAQAKSRDESSSQRNALEQTELQIRRHVAAHNAVSPQYVSAPSYSYSPAIDGTRYITSGDVSFETSAIANEPQQTLSKAQLIQRAALAPNDPTPSDFSASQRAQQLAYSARLEMQTSGSENIGTSIDTYI